MASIDLRVVSNIFMSWVVTLPAGAFLAIGSCISALTKNQVIAFIVASAICFLFVMSGQELVSWLEAAFRQRPGQGVVEHRYYLDAGGCVYLVRDHFSEGKTLFGQV